MAYTCNNPKELKDAILRRLGAPVINVEVTEEQVYDCIQRAIELYGEYHYEGLNKSYMAVKLTADQAKTGLIMLDKGKSVYAVTKILRTSFGLLGTFGGTPYLWFQDFINGLSSGGSCSTFSAFGDGVGMYVGLGSYLNLLQDVLSPLPDFWFNSVNGQLQVFGNLQEGDTIIFEVYLKSYVDLDQTSATAGRGMRAGSHCAGTESFSDYDIYNNPSLMTSQMYKAGCNPNTFLDQGVYNVRWVKDYSTSLVKEVNGTILAKHQGMQLPGGVTVDGLRLLEEAREEIENLREELYSLEEPLPIIMG